MAGLFSYGDIKNKPRRSGFDLGNKNAFTAKVGELLPVYWKFCLPGDKFHISQEWFTRTQPVTLLHLLASVSTMNGSLYLFI